MRDGGERLTRVGADGWTGEDGADGLERVATGFDVEDKVLGLRIEAMVSVARRNGTIAEGSERLTPGSTMSSSRLTTTSLPGVWSYLIVPTILAIVCWRTVLNVLSWESRVEIPETPSERKRVSSMFTPQGKTQKSTHLCTSSSTLISRLTAPHTVATPS